MKHSSERTAPASLEAVELILSDGTVCMAEWAAASTDSTVAAVLLHDKGADLDEMRPLARELTRIGLSVVNIDLPGHGMSQGDYAGDGAAAVEAAAELARTRGVADLAFVAHGASIELLYRADVSPSIAVVTVDPRELEPSPEVRWSQTSRLFFFDPLDQDLVTRVDAMTAHRNAWTVKVTVHPRVDTKRMSDRTIVSTSARFVLEQAGYATTRRLRQDGAR